MPHSLVQMLRGVPDFSPLDERSLLAIVGESLNLFWRAGSLIFEPGQPGDALYIIIISTGHTTDMIITIFKELLFSKVLEKLLYTSLSSSPVFHDQ